MPEEHYIQVVVFGASMTWSMRAPYGRRYADCIEAALAAKLGPGVCVDVAACGAGGNTAREALPRLGRDVIEYAPDLVVISLGANDAGREEKPVFERAFREVLERVENDTDAVVVLETTPVLDEEWHASRERENVKKAGGTNAHLEAFSHSFVRKMADEASVLLHDRFRIYHDALKEAPSVRERFIRRDGVHLTEEGNAFFAATLADLAAESLAARSARDRVESTQWLARAQTNPAASRVLSQAHDPTTLERALLEDEHTTRLLLQQARSFARRAAVCADKPATRAEAARFECLMAALLAAQRVIKPATPLAESGSRSWGLARLSAVEDVPAGLRDLLT
jgi:lysophospholipase L1-like esterase